MKEDVAHCFFFSRFIVIISDLFCSLTSLRKFKECLEILQDQKEVLQQLIDGVNSQLFYDGDDEESVPIHVVNENVEEVEENDKFSYDDNAYDDAYDDTNFTFYYDYQPLRATDKKTNQEDGNDLDHDPFYSGKLETSDKVEEPSNRIHADTEDIYDYSYGTEQPIDESGALVEAHTLDKSPYHQSNERNDTEEYSDGEDLSSYEFQTPPHELHYSANKLGKIGSVENVFNHMDVDPFDDGSDIPNPDNIEKLLYASPEISKSPRLGDNVNDPYQEAYNEVMDILDEMKISMNESDVADFLDNVNEEENLLGTASAAAAKPDLKPDAFDFNENDFDSDGFLKYINHLDTLDSDDINDSILRNVLSNLYNRSLENLDGENFDGLDTDDYLQNLIDQIANGESLSNIKATTAPAQTDIDSLLDILNKEYMGLDEVEDDDSKESYEDTLSDYAYYTKLLPTSFVQTEDGVDMESSYFEPPFDFKNSESPEKSHADDKKSQLEYYFAAAGFVKDKPDLAIASEKPVRYFSTEKTAIENAKILILAFVAIFVVFAVALLLVLHRFRRNSKFLITTRVPYKIMEDDVEYFGKKMPMLKETTKNVYSIDI